MEDVDDIRLANTRLLFSGSDVFTWLCLLLAAGVFIFVLPSDGWSLHTVNPRFGNVTVTRGIFYQCYSTTFAGRKCDYRLANFIGSVTHIEPIYQVYSQNEFKPMRIQSWEIVCSTLFLTGFLVNLCLLLFCPCCLSPRRSTLCGLLSVTSGFSILGGLLTYNHVNAIGETFPLLSTRTSRGLLLARAEHQLEWAFYLCWGPLILLFVASVPQLTNAARTNRKPPIKRNSEDFFPLSIESPKQNE